MIWLSVMTIPRPKTKTCAILGSGLLLEVPIDALCVHYEKVFCVDLFHMPEVRRRCASLANVELIEADLTGCLHIFRITRNRNADLPVPNLRFPVLMLSLVSMCSVSFRFVAALGVSVRQLADRSSGVMGARLANCM